MNVFLVVVLNVGFAAVIYLLLVRRIDRKLQPGRIVENVRNEIEGVIVELNQTTDRNIGLIEDRVNRLNSVLEQADKRLSVLKREVESRTAGTERYNDILKRAGRSQTVSRGSSAPAQTQGEAADKEENAGVQGEPPPRTSETSSQHKSSAADGEASAASGQGAASKAEGRAARRREIVELHRKGIASNIIANRTGTTIGEVELIISLNDRKE